MMPDEEIPFGGLARRLCLADLGIVNGEVFEDEDFNLTLTATVKGRALANGGLSTIVPAEDLKALLDDPRLQRTRDTEVTKWNNSHPQPQK
jgi:hypothetical protein